MMSRFKNIQVFALSNYDLSRVYNHRDNADNPVDLTRVVPFNIAITSSVYVCSVARVVATDKYRILRKNG